MIHTLLELPSVAAGKDQTAYATDAINAMPVGASNNVPMTAAFNSETNTDAQSAVVAPEHLIIFSGNMSAEHKDYVTNSLLYSDLAAVYKTKQIANVAQRRKAWYDEKTFIMKGLGWAGFTETLREHSARSRKFTMDQVGLEILSKALAAAAVPGISAAALMSLASEAVKVIGKGGEPLRLFQKEYRAHQDGKFNIAVCMESPAGDVVLVSTNIYFVASQSVTNVLFWEWQSTDVDVASAGNRMVLNERRFQRGKDKLADRLDDYMFDTILDLPLGR